MLASSMNPRLAFPLNFQLRSEINSTGEKNIWGRMVFEIRGNGIKKGSVNFDRKFANLDLIFR